MNGLGFHSIYSYKFGRGVRERGRERERDSLLDENQEEKGGDLHECRDRIHGGAGLQYDFGTEEGTASHGASIAKVNIGCML